MPGQTSEGQDPQDPGISGPDPGGSLRRQQPAAAHRAGGVGVLRRQGFQLRVRRQDREARSLQDVCHSPLEPGQPGHTGPAHPSDSPTIQVGVRVVQHVPGETVHADLAPVGREPVLKVPVAKMTVFRIDIPHQRHLFHRPLRRGDGLEIRRHLPAAPENGAGGQAPVLPQAGGEGLRPAADQRRRLTGADLIGPHLMVQQHQRVPPEHGGQGPAGHGDRHGQGGLFLNAPDVQGQQPDLGKAFPVQHRPQQPDEAGAPAGVPRLGDQHCRAGRVIPPGAQRREHLPGDEDKGIAQIAVDMAQPQILHATAVLQHLGVPPGRFKSPPQQGPVVVQQGGDQQGAGCIVSHHGTSRRPAARPAASGCGSGRYPRRCWRRSPR